LDLILLIYSQAEEKHLKIVRRKRKEKNLMELEYY